MIRNSTREYYTVIYKDKATKRVLKRFDYPKDKIKSKFFWEKIKLEELARLTKGRMIDPEDVIMSDYTGFSDTN